MVVKQEKKPKDKVPPSYKEKPKAADYDETLHWVRFNYNEQPGQILEFTFGKTIWNENTRKLGTLHERWKMIDGKVYQLPRYIIQHLESLYVPDPKLVKFPSGEMRTDINRRKYRFSFGLAEKPTNAGDIIEAKIVKGK